MKEQIMARFKASSSDPGDTTGVATYTYCGQSIELPMPSFNRAREVERFMGHMRSLVILKQKGLV